MGILNSGILAFYYLRVVAAIYLHAGPAPMPALPSPPARLWGTTALGLLAAVILFFGVYPSPLIRLAQGTTQGYPVRVQWIDPRALLLSPAAALAASRRPPATSSVPPGHSPQAGADRADHGATL